MGISTHILDTTKGRPARGVTVLLERKTHAAWDLVTTQKTNDDGRVKSLLPEGETSPKAGTYLITFDVGAYFKDQGVETFYPKVSIEFSVVNEGEHYHVPLLLNPFGYSTYRGS